MEEQKPLPSSHQSPQTSTTMHDQRDERILKMLKHSVLANLAATTNPPVSGAGSIAVPRVSRIQVAEQLQQVFPQSFHTPTHPPYASMILRAIEELKEKNGSNKEAISAFIKREYNDLPWGHESFLSHHLRKLYMNGNITCMNGGRYKLLVTDGNFGLTKPMASEKRLGRRGGPRKEQDRNLSEQQIEANAKEHIDMLEDENEAELQQNVAIKKPQEDQWKLKEGSHGEDKSGTLWQRLEDLVNEKQRQQEEQKIDLKSRTFVSCPDNERYGLSLNVPPQAMVSSLPAGTIEEKLQWQQMAIWKYRQQQDQQMDVKTQKLQLFQDGEDNCLSLGTPQKVLASSVQEQLSQLQQPDGADDEFVVRTQNQSRLLNYCKRNEANLHQHETSALSELHVNAQKQKFSGSKILPREETELNANTRASCSSDPKHHFEQHQQPKRRGRGRPSKLISVVETTKVVSSHSSHRPEELQPQARRQGRPRKVNIALHTTKPLQHRGRGRPPKAKVGTDKTPEAIKMHCIQNDSRSGDNMKSDEDTSAEPAAINPKDSLDGGTDEVKFNSCCQNLFQADNT